MRGLAYNFGSGQPSIFDDDYGKEEIEKEN